MTEENKKLLLTDLSARLPYEVILKTDNVFPQKLEGISFDKDALVFWISDGGFTLDNMDCKPYLFPLSSMTEEEIKEYKHFISFSGNPNGAANFMHWLNAHHFDYRGLIEKGLAIDATDKNIY